MKVKIICLIALVISNQKTDHLEKLLILRILGVLIIQILTTGLKRLKHLHLSISGQNQCIKKSHRLRLIAFQLFRNLKWLIMKMKETKAFDINNLTQIMKIKQLKLIKNPLIKFAPRNWKISSYESASMLLEHSPPLQS